MASHACTDMGWSETPTGIQSPFLFKKAMSMLFSDACSVYITAKNGKEAQAIASQLLKEKLIACANIFPIDSMYWWNGKMQSRGESAIIAKTKSSNRQKIIKRVKELHSDKVPCVVFWPISGGNKDYLEWTRKETK